MTELLPFVTGWLLRVLAIGAGVLLVGWLGVRLSRTSDQRQRIASFTVIATLLVPLFCTLPAWILIPLEQAPQVVRPVSEWLNEPTYEQEFLPLAAIRPDFASPADVPAPVVEVSRSAELPVITKPSLPTATRFDWRLPFVIGYGVVAMVLFAQLLRGHLALARLWQNARPFPARWVEGQALRRVDVRVSHQIRSAVCFGLLRPQVLLPLHFCRTATAEQMRWVLAHELDHAARGDHRTAYWLGICRAIFFVVPWFWLLRSDLRLSQEYLADAAAGQTQPVDYAAFLVQLSSALSPSPKLTALTATGVGATRSELYRRVTMLLRSRSNGRGSRWWTVAFSSLVLALAVLSSGLGIGLTAAPQDEQPPAKVKQLPLPAPKALPAEGEDEKALDPAAIQRKLLEMLEQRNLDPQEMNRLVGELQRQLMQQNRRMMEQMQGQMPRGIIVQPFPGGGVLPGFAPPAKPAIRELYEKRLKEFDDDITKNIENADAVAALRKARAAYVEAMADELKKADEEAKKNPQPQIQNFPNLQFGGDIRVLEFPEFRAMPAFPAMPGLADPFPGRGGAMRVRPTRLGVSVEKPNPVLAEQLDLGADVGLVVEGVVAGSPAEKAGLKKSDILVKLAGKAVPSDAAKFTELVAGLKAGEKFDATVIRKGRKEDIKGVELPEVRREAELPRLGRLDNDRQPGGRLDNDRIQFNQMQVQVNNTEVSIQASANGVSYTITGTAINGPAIADKIIIDDGEKKEYASVEKVPEKHRAAVKQLLSQARAFRR